MSFELFGSFLSIIVQGPLGEFGLAVLCVPQVVSHIIVTNATQYEKSQTTKTTFAFSSQTFLLKKNIKKYTIFYLGIRFYRDMENIRNLRTVIKSYVSDRWPLGLQRIWDCYSKGKLLRITKTVTQDEQFFCILLLFSLLFVSFRCYFTFYTLSLLVNILF